MTSTNPTGEALPMLERVARAICQASGLGTPDDLMGRETFGQKGARATTPFRWEQHVHQARAAIAALRTPEPLLTAEEEAELVDQINGSYYLQPNAEPLKGIGADTIEMLMFRALIKRGVDQDTADQASQEVYEAITAKAEPLKGDAEAMCQKLAAGIMVAIRQAKFPKEYADEAHDEFEALTLTPMLAAFIRSQRQVIEGLERALQSAQVVIDYAAERLWNGRPDAIAQRPSVIDAALRDVTAALTRSDSAAPLSGEVG